MLDDKNHIYLSSTNINVNKNKAQALFVRFVPYIWTTDVKISVTHLSIIDIKNGKIKILLISALQSE